MREIASLQTNRGEDKASHDAQNPHLIHYTSLKGTTGSWDNWGFEEHQDSPAHPQWLISLWWPWSSGIIPPWAQSHTEPMTKGHPARKLPLTRVVPNLKFRIIKAQKSWGTFNTVRNMGVRLPAYQKLGVSAFTKSHVTASFNGPPCTAKPSKLGVHEVPDTQDISCQSRLAALSRKSIKKENDWKALRLISSLKMNQREKHLNHFSSSQQKVLSTRRKERLQVGKRNPYLWCAVVFSALLN